MKTVRLHKLVGSEIHSTIADAIKKAAAENAFVAFDFNVVEITVDEKSDPALIYRDWDRAIQGMVEGNKVGPHPGNLTEAELASDARIKAENEARRAKRDEERRKQAKIDATALAAALSDAPVFALSDPNLWASGLAKNTDPYGRCCYDFAQAWGRLMQAEVAKGRNLIEVAEECCSLADKKFGISGFMYGAAVSILATTWIYGKDLNRWHNAKYGREDVEGTVDPAILTAGPAST